ncbi:hypothetical protein TYRP_021333 [Tyrophagus putrescentiae]|nr:hypothetical protein TYRP_021333 [Tyrophagus putrescentiae]
MDVCNDVRVGQFDVHAGQKTVRRSSEWWAQPTDDSTSSQEVQQKQSQVIQKTRLKIMNRRIATLLNGNIALSR